MADPSSSAPAAASAPSSTVPKPPKPVQQNQAFRMLGLPVFPRKLPSRNWMIFWTVSTTITGAIIYDRREKKRATARWAHAVSHLANEPLPSPSAMPRKLTIYLQAPPGDGLRIAQDHFTEYVKPVLAASGLDWDFVQGRMQGDVRAVVAERVRRARRNTEADIGGKDSAIETSLQTEDDAVETWRRKNNVPEFEGVRGDIVIGRHTWKEYIRGLHEGWLGPLAPPPEPEPELPPAIENSESEGEKAEEKPKRPPQIKPYNSVEDYSTAHLPLLIPSELTPSTPIPFPHILGFLNTPTRTYRYFTQRRLADEIGREVAAVCLGTYREFRQADNVATTTEEQWEQQTALAHEEQNWVKSTWKEEETTVDDAKPTAETPKTEKIWPRPVVMDPRVAMRMRRFELLPEDEERARQIVIPEEEIEGWIKGNLRHIWRWGAGKFSKEKKTIPLDDEAE